ncbi:DUF6232 family protein [Streptomyces sp. NPDC057616]|uniref:DUF6232 family protein n=1 Tax=Streptomyces sp. NPDC057616 TaxID=3346183 RepID=UPI0036B83700
MSYSRDITDVHVSKGALWIGSDTYPLRNIARTSMRELVPNRAAARSKFVKGVIIQAAVLLFGLGMMGASGLVGTVIVLVAAGLAVRGWLELQKVLNAPTLYVLQITTSGTPQTALTSDDQKLMDQLFHQLMEAMDNPEVQFHYQMPTYNISGDSIYQFGDHNVGKVTT